MSDQRELESILNRLSDLEVHVKQVRFICEGLLAIVAVAGLAMWLGGLTRMVMETCL